MNTTYAETFFKHLQASIKPLMTLLFLFFSFEAAAADLFSRPNKRNVTFKHGLLPRPQFVLATGPHQITADMAVVVVMSVRYFRSDG